jgi:hypothetical protein
MNPKQLAALAEKNRRESETRSHEEYEKRGKEPPKKEKKNYVNVDRSAEVNLKYGRPGEIFRAMAKRHRS